MAIEPKYHDDSETVVLYLRRVAKRESDIFREETVRLHYTQSEFFNELMRDYLERNPDVAKLYKEKNGSKKKRVSKRS